MRLDRLLSIVISLLNRDKISAPQMAARYGVSVRTIYRDLDAIQAAGTSASSTPAGCGTSPSHPAHSGADLVTLIS